MAKIKVKLGARPETFVHPVEVKLHEGDLGVIKMTYIYRTRKQFAALVDEIFQQAKERKGLDDQKPDLGDVQLDLSLSKIIAESDGTNIDYIMRIARDWDIQNTEFNRDTVAQLCDELPAAALAIIDTYRSASLEGRLGN